MMIFICRIYQKSTKCFQSNQYEQNICSDSRFRQESVAETDKCEETIVLITDGGYGGGDTTELAKSKNIDLVTTTLIGKDAPDVYADFQYNEDGSQLLKCAAEYAPDKCSYTKTTKQVNVTFAAEHCQDCPYVHSLSYRVKDTKHFGYMYMII